MPLLASVLNTTQLGESLSVSQLGGNKQQGPASARPPRVTDEPSESLRGRYHVCSSWKTVCDFHFLSRCAQYYSSPLSTKSQGDFLKTAVSENSCLIEGLVPSPRETSNYIGKVRELIVSVK